jgi:cytochrome c biogenesis protein CcmG, thiol:disulfide interchange protein DsbE
MAKPRPKQTKVGIESVQGSKTTPIIIGVVGVVVVMLIVAVVIASTTGNKKSSDANAVEFQPVKVIGSNLPNEYSDSQGQNLDVAAGSQAPELQGKGFLGNPIDIKADGKPKVVIFFAHWCPHCQREVPILSQWLQANMSKYPKVSFYGVATASDPTKPNYPPSAWLKREKWPTPVMADDNAYDAANSFGLGAYPYMVALDGQNKVITRTSGELSTADFASKIVQPAENS